jgi:hypothetical protein
MPKQGTIYLVSPDGKEKVKFLEQDVERKVSEGWSVDRSQGGIGTHTEHGDVTLTPGSYEEQFDLGREGGLQTTGEEQEVYEAEESERQYGDRGGEAFLAGAARGMTFGLSDLALTGLGIADKETLAGLKGENEAASLAGELGSIVGGGIAGAGKGLIGRAASKAPVGAVSRAASRYGEKGTRQYLTGQAAEGMLQGVGMSVSEVALSDTPWASETAARELLQGGLMGGALGLGGAAALKGAGAVARKVRTPKAPDILDITTPNGKAYLDNVASSVQKNLDIGDDVFVKTDLEAARRITPQEVEGLQGMHRQVVDEVDDIARRLQVKRDGLAAHTMEVPGKPLTDSAADLAAYEKNVAKIADVAEANKRTLSQLDEQLAAVKGHKESLAKAGWAKAGASVDDVAADIRSLGSKGRLRFDIKQAQKTLGEDPYYAQQFMRSLDETAEFGSTVAQRAKTQIPDGLAASRKAFQKADQAAKKMFGTPTGMSMSKVVGGSPEEVVEAFNVLQRRAVAAEELALVSGDRNLLSSLREQYSATSDALLQAMPRETAEAMSKTDMAMTLGSLGLPMLSEGPYDNVAGMAVMFSILKKGRGVNQLAKAVKGGGKVSSSLPGQMAQAGAGAAAYSAMPGGKGLLSQAASGAAARGAYKILGRGMDAMATPGGIFRVAGKAQSEMRQAIGALGKKAVKGSLTGGGGAATILRGMKIGEDMEKKSKEDDDLYALFKQKSEALREIAHNQQALEMAIWEDTKELRGANPVFGDGAEVTAGRGIKYLQETMPRDPGGYDSFSGSTWRPDEFAIHQWASRVKAVMDPLSVVRGVKDGTITAEGAETLRTVYPETFAKIQMEIAVNKEEIAKNLSYDEENRLSILMGVPVNAVTQPDYINFIAQSYAQRQQQQTQGMQRVDSDALMQGTPTRAQQLLNKDR